MNAEFYLKPVPRGTFSATANSEITAIVKAVQATVGRVGLKRGPKPKGEGPHNLMIEQRIRELSGELGPEWEHAGGGLARAEQVILTPGGHKQSRRTDITFENRVTGQMYHENVGRTRADGTPVTREVKALDDLEAKLGARPKFTPYDR